MIEQRVYGEIRAASWGAIFAGTVTVLAVSILLSLLGAALGFSVIDAQSDDPLAGVGATFGISSAVILIVSLAAGGYVAGKLAGQTGATHGFLTWAVALLVTVLLSGLAVSGAARLTVSAIGSVVSAVGSVAGSVGQAGANAAGSVIDAVGDNLIGDVDFDEAGDRLREALQNTDIEALQPENLEAAWAGARQDIAAAFRELRFAPGEFADIAGDLLDRLAERAASIADEIDRQEVVAALIQAGLTPEEAEEAVDGAIEIYAEIRDTVQAQIASAEETLDWARAKLAELEEEARVRADAAADAVARASLWAFFAALIGALIGALAGSAGARSRRSAPLYSTPTTP